ncbi:MAG: acyltransferase [Coriobacteriia bacterium]|nr:acyltransferase [Coriobacteriia bacterium]
MSEASPRSRDPVLDALRGVAIILVVLGHSMALSSSTATGVSGLAFRALSSVHLPLFVLISGYLSPRNRRHRVRWQLLLVPYFAWAALTYLADSGSAGIVLWLGRAAVNPYHGGLLWFLYALLGIELVAGLLRRIPLALAVGISLIFYLLPPLTPFFGVLYIQSLLVYFVIGQALAEAPGGLAEGTVLRMMPALGFAGAAAVASRAWMATRTGVAPDGIPVSEATVLAAFRQLVVGLSSVAIALTFAAVAYLILSRFRSRLSWIAWVGTITLGIYAVHGRFLVARGGPLGTFVIALLASIAVTMLLNILGVTRLLFLGRTARLPGPPIGGSGYRRKASDAPGDADS